jgi:hypothetical protein
MPVPTHAHLWKKTAASMSVIRGIAESWIAKHPELKSRIEKAIPLTVAITKEGPNTYVVENPDSDKKTNPEYTVTVKGNTSTCTCEDFLRRGSQCKHRLAVGLMVVSDKKASPPTPSL